MQSSDDEEVKDFVLMNFGEYFKSVREKLYCKLSEEKHLRKVAELFYSFLTTPDEVGKYAKLIEKTSEVQKLSFSQVLLIILYVFMISRFCIFLIQRCIDETKLIIECKLKD